MQRWVAISSTVVAGSKYMTRASEEVKFSKIPHLPPQPAKGEPIATASGGIIAKLITTLVDDDQIYVFDNSVPLLYQAAPDGREVTPPVVKVDTTIIADDYPLIMAASEVTILSPTWNDWLKDQVKLVTKERCATENRPESRDIMSARRFIEENGLTDRMVYPLRWKSSCFEELNSSNTTSTTATEMATVKNSAGHTKQQSLSVSDPSPNYILKILSRSENSRSL